MTTITVSKGKNRFFLNVLYWLNHGKEVCDNDVQFHNGPHSRRGLKKTHSVPGEIRSMK